jgi:hypothetical protein
MEISRMFIVRSDAMFIVRSDAQRVECPGAAEFEADDTKP